jgi:monoamine oxidase
LKAQLRKGSVKLNMPVVAVEETGDGTGVVVRTKMGEKFSARKVIVSVPTPVYKYIHWSPALPGEKMSVAKQIRYGSYAKYIVLFKKPFWRDAGCCGLSQSFIGPITATRDTSIDDEDNFAMTCFIGGVFARKWSVLPAEEKKASVLQQIGEIFADGKDVADLCLGVMESPWMSEEWSGWGCPCPVMPPGVMDKGFEELCRPIGTMHFVGTEMANVWRGYMEGAIRSGERGALEVIEALGKPFVPKPSKL